jgi:hypothetical protein
MDLDKVFEMCDKACSGPRTAVQMKMKDAKTGKVRTLVIPADDDDGPVGTGSAAEGDYAERMGGTLMVPGAKRETAKGTVTSARRKKLEGDEAAILYRAAYGLDTAKKPKGRAAKEDLAEPPTV